MIFGFFKEINFTPKFRVYYLDDLIELYLN